MKRSIIFAVFLIALLVGLVQTTYAAEISVCRDPDESRAIAYVFTGLGDPATADIFFSNEISVLDDGSILVDALDDGTATVWYRPEGEDEYIVVTGDENTPLCGEASNPGIGHADGGLATIMKDVAPGCYEWSIQDDYGHWSTVATTCSQVEDERVFVRLVLGRDNDVTEPERYRVWRVEATPDP